jgi:hypothetical protein
VRRPVAGLHQRRVRGHPERGHPSNRPLQCFQLIVETKIHVLRL